MGERVSSLLGAFCLLTMLSGCGAMVVGGAAERGHREPGDVRSPSEVAVDGRIVSAVNRLYIDSDAVNAMDITVRSLHGVVYLEGHVHDAYVRGEAVRLARGVKGVRRVVSRLRVVDH